MLGGADRPGYGARIGPRSLLRVPVFVAAVTTLALSLVGRLAWTAWPAELVTNFPVQLTVGGLLVTLAAILVPDLVFVDQQLWLAPSNPKLLAGLASCLIFAFFRSMIGSLIGGMAVYWVVGYLFAG